MSFSDMGIKNANELAQYLAEVLPPRALQYARTATDQMRVVVDTGTVACNSYWGSSNVSPGWYSTGAPMAMDAREVQREATNQTMLMMRDNWTFS